MVKKVKKKRLKQSELEQFGASVRSYDSISETDNEEGKRIIAGAMRWMISDPRKPFKESGLFKKIAGGVIELGFGLQAMESADANNVINALGGDVKKNLTAGGANVLVKLYYNMRDVLARRRVKTALVITGMTLAGAAAGAALGAAVIPLIGGVPGAVIGAIVGALGGAVGLGLIGGIGGGWLGKKFSDRVFRKEKEYQISTRQTNALKKHYGISNRTFLTMNAYLYNRANASKSPLIQRHYNQIRKQAIAGNYEAIKLMARFFCYELILLHSELNQESPPVEIYKDIATVKKILADLQKSNLSFDLLNYIEDVLAVFAVSAVDLDVIKDAKKTVEFDPKPPLRRRVLISEHRENPPRLEPELGELSVDLSKSKLDENALSETLVNRARMIYKKTKNPEITVYADGDDKMAVQLMAAALKADLKPTLDEKEYPKHTHEEKARRNLIIEKAYKLAGQEPPQEKKKVGFRFIKE